jgi:hypothetical protein
MPAKLIRKVNVHSNEMLYYQYMPIKVAGSVDIITEPRLDSFKNIIKICSRDYRKDFGDDAYIDSYIYFTAKHMYQAGVPINRPGWHIDGFGSDSEINYIWSSVNGTIFNDGPFTLSSDCKQSIIDMYDQINESKNYMFQDRSLVRLDTTVVHKPSDAHFSGYRLFIKLSFSREPFNLIGNTVNYMLKEQHPPMTRGRSNDRNRPY